MFPEAPMLWLVPALLSTTLALAPGQHSSLEAPDRRVRSTDRYIISLLQRGMDRSKTFAELVTALNTTDVIVYIERAPTLPSTLAGRLLLLPIAGQQRYLRIQVRADLSPVELIALMGHELRHALEIAEHPAVRDGPAMLTLYQRIGHPSTSALHTFDTQAAQTTGRRVRIEMVG
jgi:hypothetical protein